MLEFREGLLPERDVPGWVLGLVMFVTLLLGCLWLGP